MYMDEKTLAVFRQLEEKSYDEKSRVERLLAEGYLTTVNQDFDKFILFDEPLNPTEYEEIIKFLCGLGFDSFYYTTIPYDVDEDFGRVILDAVVCFTNLGCTFVGGKELEFPCGLECRGWVNESYPVMEIRLPIIEKTL